MKKCPKLRKLIPAACILISILTTATGCNSITKRTQHKNYTSATFIYQKFPPWGLIRIQLKDTEYMTKIYAKEHKNLSFTITHRDSLDDISTRLTGLYIDTSPAFSSMSDAAIVVLLKHRHGTDTIVSNARPEFRFAINSKSICDSSFVMYMINSVAQRDTLWKRDLDSLLYDGQFHFKTSEYEIDTKR